MGLGEGGESLGEKLPEMAAIRPGTGVPASLDSGPEAGRARSQAKLRQWTKISGDYWLVLRFVGTHCQVGASLGVGSQAH